MRLALVVVAALLLASDATYVCAQSVSGRITDASGEPLPFATVTIVDGAAGAAGGTTASLDGRYALELDGGGATLEFRYIGYARQQRSIAAGTRPVTVDVVLAEAAYELAAPTISAAAEDPAYRIMREAAARRADYLQADPRYEVDVYLKGQLRVLDAPERIMGQDVGDMDGLLDSSRAGIVYLSEAYSTIQVERPDKFKETITASKVSGDSQGYTFNTAQAFDFDLYQESAVFGRPIMSPLVAGAPQHYRFRMLGSRLGERGRLVYRIAVEPRGSAVPAWRGTVYVEDESFHVVDATLAVPGAMVNSPGVDSLFVAQSYSPRAGERWEVEQRRLELAASLLGFRIAGVFVAVYSDYDYAPAWAESPFGRITTEVLPGSNAIDSTVFAGRPIPLTGAEARDYVRKDSIRLVRESPAYRDSVEARNNRVSATSLLSGYTRDNWRDNTRWEYGSPLSDFGFHPVTGLVLGASLSHTRERGLGDPRGLTLGGRVRYGFADRRIYPTLRASWRLDALYASTLTLEGGRELADYHRLSPVDPALNLGYVLARKRNYLFLYQSTFARVSYDTELRRRRDGGRVAAPWARLRQSVTFEERRARGNASDYSFSKRERELPPNAPLSGLTDGRDPVSPGRLLRYTGGLSLPLGARYTLRPDAVFASAPARVTLGLDLRIGRQVDDPVAGPRASFGFVSLSAKRADLGLGRFGRLGYRGEAGAALWASRGLETVDAQQFGGSELVVNTYADYLTRFLALPHYGLVTADPWGSLVVEHDFDGWIWQRLPLLRRLGWSVVARVAGIVIPERDSYHAEVGVGINRVGFGLLRLLRADVAWAHRDYASDGAWAGSWGRPVYRIGLTLPAGLAIE